MIFFSNVLTRNFFCLAVSTAGRVAGSQIFVSVGSWWQTELRRRHLQPGGCAQVTRSLQQGKLRDDKQGERRMHLCDKTGLMILKEWEFMRLTTAT
jgi:hypothetical protein